MSTKTTPSGEAPDTSEGELTELDDWRLLQRAESNVGALDLLFERHRSYLFRVAWGFCGEAALAEDITQEVFLRLFRDRRRFRPKARLRTLLYRMAFNVSRELARKRRRELPLEPDWDESIELTALAEVQAHAWLDLVRALRTLPDRQRAVVVLRHLEGLSTQETAAALGLRAGTVKAHLHRALGRLRREL